MRSTFYNRDKRGDGATAFMERLVERGMHTNKIAVASANKAVRIASTSSTSPVDQPTFLSALQEAGTGRCP